MESAPSGNETWQESLDAVFEGNVEQFGRLCEEYLRPKFYPFALILLNNPDDADDVVQGVFERLLTYYPRIRKRELASVEAFVMTMVKNGCRDLWKKQRRLRIDVTPVDDDYQTRDTTEREITRREILRVMNLMIQRELNEQDWEIFSMKVLDGLTYREISIHTGIPLATLHAMVQNIFTRIGNNTTLRAYWEDVKE